MRMPGFKREADLAPKGADQEAGKSIDQSLSPEGRRIHSGLGEKARNIASKMYEGLYKIPGVRRLMGKMEIAFDESRMHRHEKKEAKHKGKMDELDIQIAGLDNAKSETEKVIADLERQGMPGAESLRLELAKIDEQKTKLLGKKDKTQDKFEKRENKAKIWSGKRDQVADRLKGEYDKKLKPMEGELSNLESRRDRMDLAVAVTRVRHKELNEKVKSLEENKKNLEINYQKAGYSERQIRKLTKSFENQIANIRSKMKSEVDALEKRKMEINKRISKVDKEANPFRRKNDELARIKSRRPIDMKVEKRTEVGDEWDMEKASVHTRREDLSGGEEPAKKEDSEGEVNSVESEFEGGEAKELEKISDLASRWNKFLEGKGKKGLDTKDFFNELRSLGMSEGTKVEGEDFKVIVELYCKSKKIPFNAVEMSEFLQEAGI